MACMKRSCMSGGMSLGRVVKGVMATCEGREAVFLAVSVPDWCADWREGWRDAMVEVLGIEEEEEELMDAVV